METEIINKIAESGIVTIDLEKYYPLVSDIAEIDFKDYLFMGQILREKDFRAQLQLVDWSVYTGKKVCIFSSVDALIPQWAYMLFAVHLQPEAAEIFTGSKNQLIEKIILEQLQQKIQPQDFEDVRVVIKGCGKYDMPASAYTTISVLLRPVVKSLMYGEPCSTVPVYKKKMNAAR